MRRRQEGVVRFGIRVFRKGIGSWIGEGLGGGGGRGIGCREVSSSWLLFFFFFGCGVLLVWPVGCFGGGMEGFWRVCFYR